MIHWCETCDGDTEFEHSYDECQPGRVREVWACINCGFEIEFEMETA